MPSVRITPLTLAVASGGAGLALLGASAVTPLDLKYPALACFGVATVFAQAARIRRDARRWGLDQRPYEPPPSVGARLRVPTGREQRAEVIADDADWGPDGERVRAFVNWLRAIDRETWAEWYGRPGRAGTLRRTWFGGPRALVRIVQAAAAAVPPEELAAYHEAHRAALDALSLGASPIPPAAHADVQVAVTAAVFGRTMTAAEWARIRPPFAALIPAEYLPFPHLR